MAEIHPTALIDEGAQIGDDVSIGPYSLIGKNVSLASGVKIYGHVVIDGNTQIGSGTQIFPFSSIGLIPQDKKFDGEDSRLEIGENNVIREHVTMNPGTSGGGGVTKVGSNGLYMVGAHIAHDCIIGDDVILANNATVAGHCIIGDRVILGGLCALHQFVRIGDFAFVGGMTGVEADIIPFGMAMGNRASLAGLNLVGMRRSNIPREQIHAVRSAYKKLFAEEGTLMERVELVDKEYSDDESVQKIVNFIKSASDRSFCVPQK
jgi:UDP-N-acetylglucosamine acyltransferase